MRAQVAALSAEIDRMSIDRLRIEAVIARGDAAVSVPDVAAIRRGVTFETRRYVIERLDVRARTRVLDDGRRVLDVLLTLPGVEQSRAVIVSRDIHIAAHSDRRPALAITLPLPPPGPHARNAAGRFTPTPRPSPETKRAPRRGR